ncbi:MAG: ATP-dependent helicase HrpB [Roseibaca calidilacus]|uniref:ATP-dependent helicase HrpB n=1 Tax=Roseibaca calidilacus TaxID=1666912 RepID=A0A0N8K784_9RHOB|nr:ATP-dependent helicase HrpB [Roseibaca calidilacus]KPP91025.1 MAG: ATP-dependent helicase HrpB [Roseibaca calidilacus]CUX83994.1 ATP-dependent helicase HrpB [Roseibaca calidilacus]
MRLPIDDILPDLKTALAAHGRAVLQAPPGAGKTTRVPLALLDQIAGRIVMLEPRRIAARAAAEQMARLLGEDVGATVGYRIRGEAVVSKATRIEVVTEGILTRMLQSDPELTGVGAVIFDEFHERSLNADLGLALTYEVRSALRPDLVLLVMSATLDADPVAALLDDAPILTAQGRAFPVETRWLDRPRRKEERFENAAAALVLDAAAQTEGAILVFLPGEGEIRRVASLLEGRVPGGAIRPLYGALPMAAQRAAIAPDATARKIVLATSIAETSLTIEDVRVVVDCGLARRARFDPGTGMSRLVTERVTRAEATQRAGRAGRVAEGVCFRMWARAEEGALAAFAPPEIARADLAGLALELAAWGGDDLRFLTPPPDAALAEARALLADLGALDGAGRITAHGRAMVALPLHPRLAHMVLHAGQGAAPMAALLSEGDVLRAAPVDLSLRLDALRDAKALQARHPYDLHRPTLERARDTLRRIKRQGVGSAGLSPAEIAALAYPDRIGLRRKGDAPRYVLSGGKGAVLPEGDPLAQARLLVVTDTDGDPREARIRQAITIAESDLRGLYGARFRWDRSCHWSKRERKIVARECECFGALVLHERHWRDPDDAMLIAAACDGLRDLGLPMSDAARRFLARVALLRAQGAELPDMSENALLDGLEDWLGPYLSHARSAEDLRALDLLPALRARLDWAQSQMLDEQAPAHFVSPLGNRVPIDYSGDAPEVQLRLQELFGQATHPTIGPGRVPLRLVLLSPARRPVQVTTDLPGFWANSYADVRKDMRGQYPKHPWPENPVQADPTLRAKPRKG